VNLRRPGRRGVILGAAIIATLGVALLLERPAVPGIGDSPAAATIEEGGVRVELRHLADDSVVEATYTPLRDGFHLYGPDLPRDGIDGAGRPTLLELAPGSAWRAGGPVTTEPATTLQTLPTFDDPFPVFPAGPATLRLPVERAADNSLGELRVSVTYMACSDAGICLAPVEGRVVTIGGS
jgi:hypothetical protein